MLLLSIHPKHVDAILAGTKTMELRRRRPRVSSGDALIYATSPRMELVAMFRIGSVICTELDSLWRSVEGQAGISRREFDTYYAGLTQGVAIKIADVVHFPVPIPLATLRREWQGFHPPQGFRYVDASQLDGLHPSPLKKAS